MISTDILKSCCANCGGDLQRRQLDGAHWKCKYCGYHYTDESAERAERELRDLLDDYKRELVSNLRRNLYKEVREAYVSERKVREYCMELKTYLPDDFHANFYDAATSYGGRRMAQYLRELDVDAHADDMDCAVEFLISSLQAEYLLELNNLIERVYKKRDMTKYEYYITLLSEEAVKVQSGIYETKLPREVFVAYSSKDMDRVSELVEVLERQKLQCFVAARNLRHGKGAVENYHRLLKEAMDHCKVFVFVSSCNSRSIECDAWKVEMEYVRNADISRAPGNIHDYSKIPREYKMPRVEYFLEDCVGSAAERVTRDFFDGYERVYTPEAVAERVIDQLRAKDPKKQPPFVDEKQGDSRTSQALLKRGFLSLGDGNWEEADGYFEKILNVEPECGEAYAGKLLVELHLPSLDMLGGCSTVFEDNPNYRRAYRFGDYPLREKLQTALHRIKYRAACELIDREEYHEAKVMLDTLENFSDAKKKSRTCQELLQAQFDRADMESALADAEKQIPYHERAVADYAKSRLNRFLGNLYCLFSFGIVLILIRAFQLDFLYDLFSGNRIDLLFEDPILLVGVGMLAIDALLLIVTLIKSGWGFWLIPIILFTVWPFLLLSGPLFGLLLRRKVHKKFGGSERDIRKRKAALRHARATRVKSEKGILQCDRKIEKLKQALRY